MVVLRKADIVDVEKLREIGIQTFTETFSSQNTEENMNQYLKKAFATNKLTEELSDPNTQFYFAELNGKIIGYLKVNTGKSKTELKNTHTLEIERIYVLKEYHGKNIGQMLLKKAISLAKEIQAEFIWLGVWEHNEKAIRFYSKNGFTVFDRHIFKLGNDEQTDIMMKLNLNS